MRAPTVSAYGLRLPLISRRGRVPASRIAAIASMAQSQRLSASKRATFTNVGLSPNAARRGAASVGGIVFSQRSAIPFGSTAASTSRAFSRSEEHTSELQSPCNLVCRLLLEKKKQTTQTNRSLRLH